MPWTAIKAPPRKSVSCSASVISDSSGPKYVRVKAREQAKERKVGYARQQGQASAESVVEQRRRCRKRRPLPDLDAYER